MSDVDLFPLLRRISESAAQNYEKKRRQEMARYLETVDPETLEGEGERLALEAFRRARAAPFYKRELAKASVRPGEVRAIADFKKLPILSKRIFAEEAIGDLARDGNLRDAKTVLTSSGFSGIFSFGINLKKNLENTARLIDFALDYVFDISRKKTLVINCLPMGVKVHTNAMVLAEVSVRDDMALAVVKKFGEYFQQIIVIGEAFFLKHLVEEGLRQGVDWAAAKVSLVAGEDSFPENYRTYISGLLGIDADAWPMARLVGSSLGIAELDLNLFHETPDTIRLRRLAAKDAGIRQKLFGDDAKTPPMLFHYYPHRTYLETNEAGELIITMLSPYLKIPLVRYNSGDRGRIISCRRLQEILGSSGRADLAPRLKMPLVAVYGRAREPGKLPPEVMREILFERHEIARAVTGFFKIKESGGGAVVNLQLARDAEWLSEYGVWVRARLGEYGADDIGINAVAYYDFREALVLDYNKKFHHI